MRCPRRVLRGDNSGGNARAEPSGPDAELLSADVAHPDGSGHAASLGGELLKGFLFDPREWSAMETHPRTPARGGEGCPPAHIRHTHSRPRTGL